MAGVEILTLLTSLLVILFIIYYIWVAVLVTRQHQDIQVYHTSQNACIKSPLEIETTRYQTMHLHKDYNPEDYDHEDVAEAGSKNLNVVFGLFSAILMAGSLGFVIWSSVSKVSPLISVNILIFITTFILTVALFTNNFTENKVVKEYLEAYKALKQRLDTNILHTTNATTGEIITNISKLEDLPEELTASLVQRYSAYNEINNYFKMTIYSDYEMYQRIKEKLEVVDGTTTKLRIDELMRFLKFNYDNDRADLKTDIDILVGEDSYKTLAGNKFDPYESLKQQYINIITALIIIISIIIYYIYHSIYAQTTQVGLLVTVIALLVLIMVFILMVYRFTL